MFTKLINNYSFEFLIDLINVSCCSIDLYIDFLGDAYETANSWRLDVYPLFRYSEIFISLFKESNVYLKIGLI